MKYRVERAGKTYELDVSASPDGFLVTGPDGQRQQIQLRARPDGSQTAITPWGDIELRSARRGAELWAQTSGGGRLTARVERVRPGAAGSAGNGSAGVVRAPMAGKLLRLEVKVGDELRAGQAVAVIEAMKMENELLAPIAGVVVELGPQAPSAIERGALLVKIEPR